MGPFSALRRSSASAPVISPFVKSSTSDSTASLTESKIGSTTSRIPPKFVSHAL
jgi:hypothetical protein